jgi:hypothetical protein
MFGTTDDKKEDTTKHNINLDDLPDNFDLNLLPNDDKPDLGEIEKKYQQLKRRSNE